MSRHQKPKRCYESHPPLVLAEVEVFGGNCSTPIITDANVYVALNASTRLHDTTAYPWEPGHSFLFYIQDMGVPKDSEQFKKLIDWLVERVTAKEKVHIGCIGGHGRTGMVLSALASVLNSEKDAITFVRDNYCQKAVESAEQVAFLEKHFGILTVKGAKEYDKYSIGRGSVGFSTGTSIEDTMTRAPALSSVTYVGTPLPNAKASIWGACVRVRPFDKPVESVIITP